MTSVLIEERILRQFESRVLPVLEAKGMSVEGSRFEEIIRLFMDDCTVWDVRLDVPRFGSVHDATVKPSRPIYLHDSPVIWNEREQHQDGVQRLRVKIVDGRSARCESVDENTKLHRTGTKQKQFVAISSGEITLLVTYLAWCDAFSAIDLWANELVPLPIAAQRVGRQLELRRDNLELVDVSRQGFQLVTQCFVCNGEGELQCERCSGSGEYKPRRECPKCNGSGNFKPRRQCPKCGGSGNYVGKYGDVMGSCRACDGAGYWAAKPCRSCDGNGYWPAQPCNSCDGSGSTGCFWCRGEAVQPIYLKRDIQQYVTNVPTEGGEKTETFAGDDGFRLQHRESRIVRDPNAGARSIIESVESLSESRYALSPGQSREVRSVQQVIGGVSECLQKALDAVDPDPYTGPPIKLSLAGATTERKGRSAVYDFRLVGKNGSWQKSGESPLGEMAPLKLLEADGQSPLELSLQADKTIADKSSNVNLLKVNGSGSAMTFTIQFPAEVDPSEFPETFAVLPDKIPPGEKQQIRHVRRFAHPSNQSHAVIPAMVVPEGIEFEKDFEYFDSTIGNNRRQAEAVQLGLSDIGLSLLKGPPGTGKTTVITEIVRQRIKQGQRVLVTSKNHQAVVNVLEKLDEIGGIRMARHGASSNPGQTEQRYLAGGVRTRVHEEVYAKSQASLATLEQRLLDIEQHQPKAALALDAASELEKHRAERSRRVREAEKLRDNGLEAAHEKFQAVEDRTTAEIEKSKAEYDDGKTSAGAHIHTLQKERDSQSKRLDSLQQKLGRRSDTESAKKPGLFRSVVDRVSPEFMASTAALKTRREQAERRIQELDDLIAAEHVSLKELASLRDKLVNAAKRERMRAEKVRSEAVQKLTTTCDSELASLHNRLHEQENRLLPTQLEAVAAAEFAGEECSGDETEEYWQGLVHILALDKTRSEKKLDFIRRWVRDLEADSSSVGQCYWDNLQVFFSTCVGIASWKEMVQGAERFDFAIVDEAATVTTGETIMPLMYANAGMLVGDEMQLPPHQSSEGNLCCDRCKPMPLGKEKPGSRANGKMKSSCWLSTSYFEYLWRSRPAMSRVMLNTQYRMNPRIASFVGDISYPEGLVSGVTEEDRTLRFAEFTEPMCLISTSAYEDRFEDSRSSSYCNDLEAQMIRRVIVKAEQQLDRPAHFGIITPYAEQVRQLQSQLAGDIRSFKKVRLADDDIASVNSFQGSQRDVIIVSFVRSPRTCPRCNGEGVKAKQKCSFDNVPGQDGFDPSQPRGECRGRGWLGSSLTFVQDLQRLNVALSRAKSMVILVGDIEALTNPKFTQRDSEGREILEKFEKYVSDSGLVLRVWETGGDR